MISLDFAGRAVLTAIFFFFAALNLARIVSIAAAAADDYSLALDLAAITPGLIFSLLIIVFTIVRLPPKQESLGWTPRIVAITGTFMLTLMPLLPRTEPPMALHVAAAIFGMVGFGLSAICLLWLGRSFSVDAQARWLATTGPYAIVRHPLYLCEAIGMLSVPLDNPSFGAAAMYLAAQGFQFWRMRNEERVLTMAFPEYAAYAASVPMLVPRLKLCGKLGDDGMR